MGFYLFLGCFAAVIIIGFAVIYKVKHKIRQLSGGVLDADDLVEAILELDSEAQATPKSLSGCDSLVMPKILKDFPDFDPSLAKTYVKEYLTDYFSDKADFTIHNIVIARYLPSSIHKTIVYQAAVCWYEEEKTVQKRYELHYAYLLNDSRKTVAANCPNCGGAIGYGISVCPYCDSRIANVLGNTWEFTELIEK